MHASRPRPRSEHPGCLDVNATDSVVSAFTLRQPSQWVEDRRRGEVIPAVALAHFDGVTFHSPPVERSTASAWLRSPRPCARSRGARTSRSVRSSRGCRTSAAPGTLRPTSDDVTRPRRAPTRARRGSSASPPAASQYRTAPGRPMILGGSPHPSDALAALRAYTHGLPTSRGDRPPGLVHSEVRCWPSGDARPPLAAYPLLRFTRLGDAVVCLLAPKATDAETDPIRVAFLAGQDRVGPERRIARAGHAVAGRGVSRG